MGFYIRKSVKAGPFRFNLSKSGIGVSAGVPGFRVGTGPRGNYVHLGRNGLYYRATLAGRPSGTAIRPVAGPPVQHHPTRLPDYYHPSDVVLEDVTGSTAFALAPTGGGDVVEQLNAAARWFPWGWLATAVTILIGLLTLPFGLIVWLILAPVCIWLILNDRARQKVVLFYDVNDKHSTWFDSVVRTWDGLAASQKLWRILRAGAVATTYQFKTNAGASSIINRVNATATTAGPKQLATNIEVPSITAGNSALYFLPDRVLVREGKHFSDVAYRHLAVHAGSTRFIEDSVPPSDALQVDQTWRYVNVKGGPDRRFANNRLLPVMQYAQLDITSPQGLQWQLQVSRRDAAPPLAGALSRAPAAEMPGAS